YHRLSAPSTSGTTLKKLRGCDAAVLLSPSSYLGRALTKSMNRAACTSRLSEKAPSGVSPRNHSLPTPRCTPYSRLDTTLEYSAMSSGGVEPSASWLTTRHEKRSHIDTSRGPTMP